MQADHNMQYALWLAQGLSAERALALPSTLADVDRRAELIAGIDGLLMPGENAGAQLVGLGKRLRFLADATVESMPDVPDQLNRITIALRLWAGCLAAAKTIAAETRSGANTAQERAALFPGIDAMATEDDLFRAGVEAAPKFKSLRGQPYFLDGVPEDSPVRRYA